MKEDLLHGGALDQMRAAFPDAPTPWIDLSTGINPRPYPLTDIPPDMHNHLPMQSEQHACRMAMAGAIGAAPDSLLLSPGSELLIRLLPTLLSPQRVVIQSPTYGDHARVWRASTCEVIQTEDPLAEAGQADAIIICNPNNPDGRVFSSAELERVRLQQAARGGWLIVDEAYADLAPAISLAPSGGTDNLVILRSFGKFFGLAGVRLGALIGPEQLLRSMSERLGVWSVSGQALAIGRRAYLDHAWQAETRERLSAARARLDILLTDAGLNIAGGCDLFRLVHTPDAATLWQQLAREGIYVRRFDWSDCLLRIGLPPDEEAERRLADALSL
ncbi:threonine-phosphate decarboxylase CobD [uncultured Hyphomonas sp.]|uniref:threonine-phosphate decarboxylase CobD n=1 Tax=uncultured Hyphomonas sp. TaxID=225298 RepID=UPI002AABF3D6|nr:threonine-phosphate decarboxylase CobD [uncultured Hyphomonas sp.]